MNAKKLIARNPVTGLYFNGRSFESVEQKDALFLRPGTTAESFRLSWSCPVEVLEVSVCPHLSPEKLARRVELGMKARVLLEKRGWHVSRESRHNNKQTIIRHRNVQEPAKGWRIAEYKTFRRRDGFSIFNFSHPDFGAFESMADGLEEAKRAVYQWAIKRSGY